MRITLMTVCVSMFSSNPLLAGNDIFVQIQNGTKEQITVEYAGSKEDCWYQKGTNKEYTSPGFPDDLTIAAGQYKPSQSSYYYSEGNDSGGCFGWSSDLVFRLNKKYTCYFEENQLGQITFTHCEPKSPFDITVAYNKAWTHNWLKAYWTGWSTIVIK